MMPAPSSSSSPPRAIRRTQPHRPRLVRFHKRVHVRVVHDHVGLWYNRQELKQILKNDSFHYFLKDQTLDKEHAYRHHLPMFDDKRAIEAVLREQQQQQQERQQQFRIIKPAPGEAEAMKLAIASRQASSPCSSIAHRMALQNEIAIGRRQRSQPAPTKSQEAQFSLYPSIIPLDSCATVPKSCLEIKFPKFHANRTTTTSRGARGYMAFSE